MGKSPIDYGRELGPASDESAVADPLRAAILRGERIVSNIEVYELIKHSMPHWRGNRKPSREGKP
jgi:hypothetical protein